MSNQSESTIETPGPRSEGTPSALSPWSRRVFAALVGLVSAGLTLGVAELLAAAVAPTASPVLAVGDAFVDLTPGWLKDFAIQNFGTNDKLVLLLSIAVVLVILAAVAGLASLRNRAIGIGLVVLMGVVAAIAAVTRPDAEVLAVVPATIGTLVGAGALVWLIDRLRQWSTADPDGVDRRAFLVGTAATGAVAVATAGGGRVLLDRTLDVTASRAAITLPAAADVQPPLPDGVEVGLDGISSWITPNEDFYRIDTALTVPRLLAEDWELRITGMVDEEITLTWDDLAALPMTERTFTLTCVSNEIGGDLIGNATWLGYPIRELLAMAGPSGDADMVLSTSSDGWTAGTPLTALTDDRDALLAIGMNGEPLPLEHGFPVRMVVPGLYGFVSATKWVVEMKVSRFADETAYWTERNWAEQAPIKTASKIDVPAGLQQVEPGPLMVGGVAWAQTRGISAVQVRVDGGQWQDATLGEVPSDDTWVQWSWEWAAESGQHRLECRAIDGDGEPQIEDVVAPIPDGSSGLMAVTVRVS